MQKQAIEVSLAELSHLTALLLEEQNNIRETTHVERTWEERFKQTFIVAITNETGESDKWKLQL